MSSGSTILSGNSSSKTEQEIYKQDNGRRGYVLVVDDENGPRQALRVLLKEDFDVFLACDADSARRILGSEPIDVVITDLRMPKESGISLLEHIRETYPDVEVIILTGYGQLESAMKAVECGAFAYLEKPFDNAAMFRYVQRAVEKRRKELERRQLESLALEANRFETLGRFVSGILHDLSTPLSVIDSYIELIQTDPEKKGLDRKLEVMHEQAKLCTDLIRSAMNFLRHETGRIAPVNLNEVVEACIHVSGPVLTRHQVAIAHDLESGLPVLKGDYVLIRQAILNLVMNAVQAMEQQTEPREVHLRTWGDATGIWFSVRDTGPGIPPRLRSKVFNAFFTTKGSRGTGLGLAVVRHIMNRHGGEVMLNENAPVGAEFALRFPLPPPEAGSVH